MKKSIIILAFISLFFIMPLSDLSAEPYIICNERVYLQCQDGMYWKFTVPFEYDYLEINCSADITMPWNQFVFAIVDSKDDAIAFCKNNGKGHWYYISNTLYKGKDYSMRIEAASLNRGEEYYLCVFNNSKNIVAAKQHMLNVNIKYRN